MKLSMRIGASAIVGFSLVGCATSKFDAERTSQVKKMAVVAIEIHQQQPTDNLGIAAFKQAATGQAVGDSPELQEMALGIYQQAVKKVGAKSGWQVVSFEELKNNPTYKKQVQSMMEGLRTVSMVGGDYKLVSLKGTLDAHAFKKLSKEEKIKIAKALRVDAIGVLTTYMTIDQSWSLGNISGQAPFTLTARSNFEVFDLRDEEPIWRIQNVDGETTVNSKTLAENLSPKQKLSILGKAAADTSLSKLVDSYKR